MRARSHELEKVRLHTRMAQIQSPCRCFHLTSAGAIPHTERPMKARTASVRLVPVWAVAVVVAVISLLVILPR